MLEQMLGKRTAAQLTTALKIIVGALLVIAVASVVIAVASVIAIV
jgi:hypothetical protein